MTDYERIERVIRHLDSHYLEQPSLDELALVAGLSRFHFHRLFTRWAGTTPKNFLKSLTAAHAKALLRSSRDLLSAAYESGLSGPGRLHDLLVTIDAVTPGEFKSGGRGIEIRYGIHPTPFGSCLIGLTSRGICHFSFHEKGHLKRAREELRSEWPNASLIEDAAGTAQVVKKVFASGKARDSGKRPGRLALLVKGSPFQVKVWQALLNVPPGRVVSYGSLAEAVNRSRAARAVGTAVGRNSIAYLIPCHRVIRETGTYGQYRWSAPRKRAILAWESARST